MATQTELHSSSPSRKAKRHAQKHAKRRSGRTAVWSLTGLICAAACGELAYADIAATPHPRVSLNPQTNLLQVRLMPGHGWLADWVLAHSRLQTQPSLTGQASGANAGNRNSSEVSSGSVAVQVDIHTWAESVKPGETVRVTSTVSGPLLNRLSETQTIRVPVAPVITATQQTAKAETVIFNTPLATVKLLSGKHVVKLATLQSMTLTRESKAYTARLRIAALSGEVAALSVQVPALPPPPVHLTAMNPTLVPPVSPVPEYFFGNPSGNRVYITIDDGWYPNAKVLTLMQQTHVPLTAFLIDAAAQEHLSFWKAFVAAGGTIGDHTDTHPFLSHISAQSDVYQWHQPVIDDQKWFGVTPSVGRPPYGDVNKTVLEAAHAAGLKAIVMWSAEFNPSNPAQGISTWNGQPLTAGEIILLHWQPGLYNQLQQVLAICQQRGLVPAPLTAGLPGLS
ncbi:polysaccharide deacetylase family protein [Alicyclobacillus sp. ALC3]|uniref:polysaccharide deacetylase family protein n=1 Tax=Alicyclobacillus sp. ALC3 TaxID=2796143 RepID=UPI002377DD31|nr:polysaccharide deacetylase family protein [Alicyclobacillus sp. ALC3]WDL95784.1 polysaccharide deacetylase family protein [Alicyclobacillus sp. ALC3]